MKPRDVTGCVPGCVRGASLSMFQTRGRGATSDVYTTLKHDFGDSDTVTVDRSRVSDL